MKSREDTGVFFTLWLQNLFRATAACNFSTSQLPKVVRAWCVLCILTWKCISRHSSVQILISPLATQLRTRRFSEPTFRPSRPTNDWKNTMICDCIICFLLTLSLPLFYSALLCFSSLHVVGNLTSILPLIILYVPTRTRGLANTMCILCDVLPPGGMAPALWWLLQAWSFANDFFHDLVELSVRWMTALSIHLTSKNQCG